MRKGEGIKRVFLTIISLVGFLFSTIIPLNNASAAVIPNELMEIFNKGIGRLDVEGGEDCVEPNPDGSKVTWIGDSLTVDSAQQIKSKLSGIDIYAHPSKHFGISSDNPASQDPAIGSPDSPNPSGISILKKLNEEEKLRDYVVFALGTNDKDSVIDSNIKSASDIVGEDRKLILVTNYNKNNGNSDYTTNNNSIMDAASKYSNITVANWAEEASKKNANMAEDGVTPSDAEAKQLFVDTIYNALPNAGAGGTGSIDESQTFRKLIENTDKIAKALANSDVPAAEGGRLNAIQIAALIVNAWYEDSYDPGSHQGGTCGTTGGNACGIWQWDGDRYNGIATPRDNLENQVAFLIEELNSSVYQPDGAYYEDRDTEYGLMKGMKHFWNAQSKTDYGDAIQGFAGGWERCNHTIPECGQRYMGIEGSGVHLSSAELDAIYNRYAGLAGGVVCIEENEIGGSVIDIAREMATWGGCYKDGGGHSDTADLQRRIDSKFQPVENGVDCTGFIMAVFYKATGKHVTTNGGGGLWSGNPTDFKKIDTPEVGAVSIGPNHVEIISKVEDGKVAETIGSHTNGCGAGLGPSVASWGPYDHGQYFKYNGVI